MEVFTTLYNQCCLIKKICVKNIANKEWFTNGLKNACKKEQIE